MDTNMSQEMLGGYGGGHRPQSFIQQLRLNSSVKPCWYGAYVDSIKVECLKASVEMKRKTYLDLPHQCHFPVETLIAMLKNEPDFQDLVITKGFHNGGSKFEDHINFAW